MPFAPWGDCLPLRESGESPAGQTLERHQLDPGNGSEGARERVGQLRRGGAKLEADSRCARYQSIKTVAPHRASIIDKLGIRDRTSLTRYATRRGLVEA